LGYRGTTISNESLQATGVRYQIGPHTLDFLMPMAPQSPLISWLRAFGPSPYAATLHRTSSGPGTFADKLTHGANLSFV
jgi:hypothetical protein